MLITSYIPRDTVDVDMFTYLVSVPNENRVLQNWSTNTWHLLQENPRSMKCSTLPISSLYLPRLLLERNPVLLLYWRKKLLLGRVHWPLSPTPIRVVPPQYLTKHVLQLATLPLGISIRSSIKRQALRKPLLLSTLHWCNAFSNSLQDVANYLPNSSLPLVSPLVTVPHPPEPHTVHMGRYLHPPRPS